MKLLVSCYGFLNTKEIGEYARKSLPVFKKHGITFDGQFDECSRSTLRVDQYQKVFGWSQEPKVWIIGLDHNKWWGPTLDSLLADLEKATGIKTDSATN